MIWGRISFVPRFLDCAENKVSEWETVLRNIKRYRGSSIRLCFKIVRPPTLLSAS